MENLEDYIELRVEEISKIETKSNQFILLLKERYGKRHLPIPLSEHEAQDMLAVMHSEPVQFAPWTQIIKELTQSLGIIIDSTIIKEVSDGTYIAEVQVLQNGQQSSFRTNAIEALILALAHRSSIYISQTLMDLQYVHSSSKGSVTVPLNSLNLDMLKEALNVAIKQENYELASHLRDEIKRRS